jgi:hypothetical protein
MCNYYKTIEYCNTIIYIQSYVDWLTTNAMQFELQ